MIDYRELLMKYINHVGDCEGVTFMPSRSIRKLETPFTPEEIAELDLLDDESEKYKAKR